MSARNQPFRQSFIEDFTLSLAFSVFGAAGFFTHLPGSLGSKILYSVATMFICATSFAAALASAQTWLLPRAKLPWFPVTVALTALIYLSVILVALPVGIGCSIALVAGKPPWDPFILNTISGILNPVSVGAAFAMMVMVTSVFMVSRKLGPGVLMNWMLGRYYRPREEQRVFMFLDLRDSTRLGEELGDLKFSSLIQKFFSDLSDPVLKTKGEVSHYIGDEAVLCWHLEKGLKNANCLRCFYLMKEAIVANAAEYQTQFGVVPGFKAGAHMGSVVATQVGEIKSEIVFHGDVLNTTSRVQSMCNDLESEFLVTKVLADALGDASEFALTPKGRHSLKGKEEDVELFAVSPASVDQAARSE